MILHGVNLQEEISRLWAIVRELGWGPTWKDPYGKLQLPEWVSKRDPTLIVNNRRARRSLGWANPQEGTIMIRIPPYLEKGKDRFDVLEILCHEVAHLACPFYSGHGPVWKGRFRILLEKAYGVRIPLNQITRFANSITKHLRAKENKPVDRNQAFWILGNRLLDKTWTPEEREALFYLVPDLQIVADQMTKGQLETAKDIAPAFADLPQAPPKSDTIPAPAPVPTYVLPIPTGMVSIRTGKRGKPPKVEARFAEYVQSRVEQGATWDAALEEAKTLAKGAA